TYLSHAHTLTKDIYIRVALNNSLACSILDKFGLIRALSFVTQNLWKPNENCWCLPLVNSTAQGGIQFVGSVLVQLGGGCNGRMSSPRKGCHSPPGNSPSDPLFLLMVLFHSWPPGCVPVDTPACCYHQGALSMRVSRKGQVISGLEADWLQLTGSYYCKGWSLVDSFVYWDTPKGEPVPRSLEGLFVYEERSASLPANDTIVVEQWSVIEGSNVKSDYGPLLHTLAEFGWLLTCVLPTPIIRHDNEGNLATKQVVFLQRPVRTQLVPQKNQRLRKRDVSSPSLSQLEDLPPCPGGIREISMFGASYPSASAHLEEGGFEQDDGTAEVTCM
uniref:Raftlin family member 2 n=1 Tax=Denticeps clupeoides TaxID=299321 RepID=A0AAY4B7U3_9TELE